MTASQVLAAASVLLTALGLAMVAAGLRRPVHSRPVAVRTRPARELVAAAVRSSRWALAAGAGGVAWLVTGWPALGIAAAVGAVGMPAVVGADTRAAAQIDRVEAVEEWSRRVADVVAIGVGLEQALQTAARTAPAGIAAEASTLSARLAARMPTEEALRRFADEVADPTADLVVAALILASRRRGPGVAGALTALAESVGEEVAARRRIEADRAKPRATARAVTVITLLIMGVGLLNRGYTAPYATPLGQLVLAATLGFFATALWWMHSMTRATLPERILQAGGTR
ncbi:MAG TPA: type II secretion system F family protein [Candidatus Nanopelagicales bacterium]